MLHCLQTFAIPKSYVTDKFTGVSFSFDLIAGNDALPVFWK